MSGKKQKVVAGWFDCVKCQKRLSRQLVSKHVGDDEAGCRQVYPFLKKDKLFCLLTNVTSATKKIGELPFIKDKRLASSTIFISEDLIKECGYNTFGWVSLCPVTAQCPKTGESYKEDMSSGEKVDCTESDLPSSSYAFRVWPIPESIGCNQCNLQTVLSMDGFAVHKLIPSSTKADASGDAPFGLVEIQMVVPSVKSTFDTFKVAGEMTLVVSNFDEIDEMSFDVDRFIKSFRRVFEGRPVARFNQFKIRFYGQFVHFCVSKVSSIPAKNQEEDGTFGFDSLSIKEANPTFFQIVSTTVVHVITKEKCTKSARLFNQIGLKDIGGLQSVVTELSSTLKFILNTDLDVPKGVLVYGHIGAGKSSLVQAICNEFNLVQIHYEEFAGSAFVQRKNESSSTSLDKVFKDAVSRGPSAIVIEALDVIAPRKKSDSGAAPITPFAAQFCRLLMGKSMKHSKVLVLCTATDLDRVDPNLRSSKIFAKEIEIPIPSAPEREEIFRKMLTQIPHNLMEKDIKNIATNTHGFVAADLRSLCNQATLDAMNKHNNDTLQATVSMNNIEQCLKSVKPSAIKSILMDIPNVKWSDIGGQTDLKFKLKQAIEWPLKHPESFERLGITAPKGILMYGPPGCSKTMIAKAIATESGLNFISVKGSELFSKWVGESEKAVQTIFRKARQVAPCVVFFDEIDSLGGERGTSSGSSNVHERVLAQILVEIDGIEALKDVTIVAATNRPDRIDQALLRPGRLDRIIYVPLPDEDTRKEILKIRFRKMPVESEVNIAELVKLTEGYSGAELTALCHEAALKALEEDITCAVIKENHFRAALSVVKPRITKEQIDFYNSYNISRKQV